LELVGATPGCDDAPIQVLATTHGAAFLVPPGRSVATVTALTPDGTPVSASATVALAVKAGKVTTASVDPRPVVPIIDVGRTSTYPVAFVTDPDSQGRCYFDESPSPIHAFCLGGGRLAGLGPSFVAVLGGQRTLDFTTGTVIPCGDDSSYDCATLAPDCVGWCDVVVASGAPVKVATRPGVQSYKTKLQVDPAFAVLAATGASSSAWQMDLWPTGGDDVQAECVAFLDASVSATVCGLPGPPECGFVNLDATSYFCLGGSVLGLQAGAVAIPRALAPGSVDIEASQHVAGKHTVALATLAPQGGALTTVQLRFRAGTPDSRASN
jgi:hypothetical protein